jgi:hypothetical protein
MCAVAQGAFAQVVPPGSSLFNPPPAAAASAEDRGAGDPKMDELPKRFLCADKPQKSFGDRVTNASMTPPLRPRPQRALHLFAQLRHR